ncbi:MAG: choice-of-anchor J domain-containing protein [Wenzhouxiangella sp.]|nr:choice-of-anchor J domain-containing protein [Wenzhouxiangella sp.]
MAPFAAGGPGTAVDVVINGSVALPGVEYGDSTAYLTLPAGSVDIDIVPDGATEPAISASAFLQPGFNYTVIANGDGVNQALSLALLEDDISAPASGNFKLRLGHLAPFAAGAASAEVRLADGTLIQAVDFGDITGFLELPAGAYDLIITSPGGAAVLIDPVEVSFNDGDIVSAFAAGDGANQDLGAFALPSDAEGFFLGLNTIAPEAAIAPASFEFDLVRGDTDQAILEIGNTGSSVLSWFIDTDVPGPVAADLEFTALDTGVAEVLGFSEFTAPILSRGFDRAMGPRDDDVVGDSVIRALPRAPIVGDWSEGFESIAGLFTQGWAAQNNSSPAGTGNWTQGNPSVFEAHAGPTDSYALVNFTSGSGAATLSNWLIAPEMELQNGTEISFFTRSPASAWEDRMQVRMSTAGDSTNVGATATSVGDFTELLLDINPSYAPGGYPTVWTQYTITISGLSEPTTGRIAFRYFVEDGGPSGNNSDLIGVDTLVITQPPPPPACTVPTAVPWLSVDENSGFTQSGDTSEVTVNVDSTGLAAGTYEAVLCVSTNDPAQALVEVPVTLDVEGLPIADISPESFNFVVEQGATDDDDLVIGNLGDGPMLWSLIDAVISGTGDILYDAGPLVTNPGAGAGGADVSALQTAIGLDVFGAGVQQGAGNRMADVFEVDGSWTIDDMTFFVYQTGSTTTSTITSVSLRIWDGAPNDPASNVIFGDSTTNRLLSTQFSGIYRALDTALTNTQRPIMEVVADLEGLELEAGTYWVDVSFGGSLDSGPWMPPISIPGEVTTGTDSYQLTGGAWNPWIDTQTLTRQGMAFIVRGEALPCWAPGEPSWLSVTPVDGSVAAESSVLAAVNVDVDGLAVGTYNSKLCVATNDATNAFVEVPVNLEVTFTADTGFLEGNVQSLGYCGENPFAAEGASIVVDGDLGGSFSTTADANGDYFLAISDTESPVTVTFSAPDHLNEVVMSVDIVAGETTILDANLVLDAGCAAAAPTSFAETVAFGGTGSFALTIDNSSGGGDLDWEVETEDVVDSIGARDGHDPLLDEILPIPSFSIDSSANGGSPAVFTIPAGVLTRGDVVGFSFEGTVAGISGTGSWASDMCLRVQAPDGTIFDVGGFSAAIPGCAVNTWDFDGSGSTNNGTYGSEHLDAFDPAVGDEGDWTFTFTNGWDSTAAATMDWSDVTITLHKQPLPFCIDPLGSTWLSVSPTSGTAVAGDTSAVDVLVDTDGLASGIYAANICINTDDAQRPLIVVPFELTVEPANPVTITGQVNSLGYCSNESNAVEGALIEVLGDSGEVFTTLTDGAGIYSIVIGEAESPVTVSASAPDHITGVESGVVLVSPGSVDVDFDLVLEAACATVDPTSFADSVSVAEQKDYNLTIGNIDGAADLNWSIDFEEVMSAQLGQRGAMVPYSYRLPGAGELPRVTGASRNSAPVDGAEAAHLVAPGIQSAAITAVVEEGFNDVAALPGAGWALQNNSDPLGTSAWFQGNPDAFEAHDGPANSYLGANFNNTSGGTGIISNWALTPEVALENGTELRFWSRSTGDGFADRLEVRLSTSGGSVDVGSSATDVGDFDSVLLTINESLDPFGYPDEWTEYVVTVSGLSAPTSGRFGLRYFVTDAGPSGANSDFIGIDTLSITQPSGPPAACDDPQGVAWLSVDSSSGIVVAGDSSDVVVTVDGSLLDEGSNEALICVLTDDAQAPVLTVPITIERIELDPAVIVVDPLVLATTLADGDTDVQSLSITNEGEFPLSWEIDSTSAGCELPAWVGAVDPLAGTLGEDASEDVTVTFDATGLVPDFYEATLCITSNDPDTPLVEVALELTVVETMATIEGFVSSLGYCSDNPAPAAGAGILIEGVEGVYSTTADGSGFYQIMIPADDSPVTITATALDHLDGVEIGVALVAGEVSEVNFDLVLEAACATVAPAAIEFVLVEGSASEDLTIGNINGAASLVWSLDSGTGCYDELVDGWLTLSSDGDAMAAGAAQVVEVTADASGLMPGLYQTNLCIATSDAGADSFVVPVELDVRTDGIFQDRFEDNDD